MFQYLDVSGARQYPNYSNHLNTRLVRLLNGPNVWVHEWSGFWMVWVHRCQNNGLPFKNLTFSSGFQIVWVHRCQNNGVDLFSKIPDSKKSGIQMVTVIWHWQNRLFKKGSDSVWDKSTLASSLVGYGISSLRLLRKRIENRLAVCIL